MNVGAVLVLADGAGPSPEVVEAVLANLTGPVQRMSLAGAPIQRIVPITATAGNVGVAFAALSHAGRLTISVIADPDVVPESRAVAAALEAELAQICRPP